MHRSQSYNINTAVFARGEGLPSNKKIRGVISVPGDKSISHRALIFSALSKGTCTVSGLSPAEDCQSTADCLRKLGLDVKQAHTTKTGFGQPAELTIESPGLHKLTAPTAVLNAGNSGTTMRLMSGLVAGQNFTTRFDGDDSLRMRPMSRVLRPLFEMGAKIHYELEHDMAPVAETAPFAVTGGNLAGKHFDLKVASAQVETAILLAGLQASGETSIKSPAKSRDHTERMFRHIGVPFVQRDGTMSVSRLTEPVAPFKIKVAGDLSSAAFFIVAAACLPGSDLLIKGVGMNPGRRLVIDVLEQMGAQIAFESEAEIGGEPVADIRIKYVGRLKGATISGDTIASGIDEIPILALAGALCEGEFKVSGAAELRVKESDRLKAIVENMRSLGVEITESNDGFVIQGGERLSGGSYWRTYNDHRLAMTGLIANCIAEEPIEIEETESIKISYPGFADHLKHLISDPSHIA